MGNKQKPVAQQPSHPPQQIQQRISVPPAGPSSGQDQILPSSKQESPPAAAVRPFTPQPSKEASLPPFRKPQTVAASSIYSMYTQQQTPGKNFQQAVQSALTRAQTRAPHFPSGKHVALYLSSVFISLRYITDLLSTLSLGIKLFLKGIKQVSAAVRILGGFYMLYISVNKKCKYLSCFSKITSSKLGYQISSVQLSYYYAPLPYVGELCCMLFLGLLIKYSHLLFPHPSLQCMASL